jgi:hypothetical protein
MWFEVGSIRRKTLRHSDPLVRDLLPHRRRYERYGVAQTIEDDGRVASSQDLVCYASGRRRAWWDLTCTKVHVENRTPVQRIRFLSVRAYGHGSQWWRRFGMDPEEAAPRCQVLER